jgi:hypothetical protein
MATTREGSSTLTNPVYAQFAPSWLVARDIYEGTGGFLNPERPYLVPHPREWLDHSVKTSEGAMVPNENPVKPSPKLVMRRKLARYENIAEAILGTVVGALFLQSPTRTFGPNKDNKKISAFWATCDGKGTDMTTFARESWLVAGVFGHTPTLMEKPSGIALTAADQKLPYLCRYTPLDVLDWLEDDEQNLTAVKLAEIAPRAAFGDTATAQQRIRVRIVDEDGWRLYGPNGVLLRGAEGKGDHGFGELPFDVLYAKKRLLTPHIGKSVMGDPQLYIDLYNLVSEVRELLRNQTFAILNIPIGPEGSVESEMQKTGNQSGTSTALFSSQPAAFISPGGENVQAYHEHMDRLVRMIYRLANAVWEGDSKDAESADSRKIKRAEQEHVLKSQALELQRWERKLTHLAYIAIYGDKAEAQMEQDQVTIKYPDTFSPPDMEDVIARAGEAIGLDLGATAMKEIKKKTARHVLQDASKDVMGKIDTEIDGQQYVSEEDKRQQDIEAASAKFAEKAAAA